MQRLMSEAGVISAFAQVARPPILRYFRPNGCIAATRIAIECLAHFGVYAEAVPVGFIAEVRSLMFAYVSGLRGETKAHARQHAKGWIDTCREGWDGHLVAIAGRGNRYLIDASFDQCSQPALGFTVPPYIFMAPLTGRVPVHCFHMEAEMVTDDGVEMRVQYLPLEDRSFETMPAWETDHLQPVIAEITGLMRQLAEGARVTEGQVKEFNS